MPLPLAPRCSRPSKTSRLRSGSDKSFFKACATSIRNASTPRSAQNFRVLRKSFWISGLSQLKSGCSGANQCMYHWLCFPPMADSWVQALGAKCETQSVGGSSPFLPRPSRKIYRLRAFEPGFAAIASLNHSCKLEEWFGTIST